MGSGVGNSNANYQNAHSAATNVGAFSNSGSFYNTFDQSGNVDQWNDLDGTAGTNRGSRGGNWGSTASAIQSSNRSTLVTATESRSLGFRLASPA